MPVLRNPLGIKEYFANFRQWVTKVGTDPPEDIEAAGEADGTARSQLILADPDDDTQVRAAADKSGADKGALHVKLKSREQLRNRQRGLEAQEATVGWLKVIAFHLAEIRGEDHITPAEITEGPNEDMN